MLQLLRHLVAQHEEQIFKSAISNCHAPDLHSIVFIDTPEKFVRMFFADRDHNLHYNKIEEFCQQKPVHPLSIGYHPHHCNITLCCLKGTLINIIAKEDKEYGVPIIKYEYQSQITKDELSFKKIEDTHLNHFDVVNLKPNDCISLKANLMHTVAADQFEQCAWLVFEGKEDKDYKSYCYSNANLLDKDIAKDLYKPMEYSKFLEILNTLDIITTSAT